MSHPVIFYEDYSGTGDIVPRWYSNFKRAALAKETAIYYPHRGPLYTAEMERDLVTNALEDEGIRLSQHYLWRPAPAPNSITEYTVTFPSEADAMMFILKWS